jgi:hypothetical protein
VKAEHPNLTAPSVLSALKQASAKSAKLSDQAHCPLCHQGMTLKAMQKHLGRHQEQLALFVLPPNLDKTEVDPDDDDNISVDVKQWQDEEVSSGSDATEFGDNADSDVEREQTPDEIVEGIKSQSPSPDPSGKIPPAACIRCARIRQFNPSTGEKMKCSSCEQLDLAWVPVALSRASSPEPLYSDTGPNPFFEMAPQHFEMSGAHEELPRHKSWFQHQGPVGDLDDRTMTELEPEQIDQQQAIPDPLHSLGQNDVTGLRQRFMGTVHPATFAEASNPYMPSVQTSYKAAGGNEKSQ